MQHTQDGGVIISCDFCGTDWDPHTGLPPMTEGHHGSVLCLTCLQRALREARPAAGEFACTLCLKSALPETLARWSHPDRPQAIACRDCINLGARTFHRDGDVDWQWDGRKVD